MTTETPITTAEAAKRLRVSKVTIQRWIRSGRLPARKLPGDTGAYLISPADLDRLAA